METMNKKESFEDFLVNLGKIAIIIALAIIGMLLFVGLFGPDASPEDSFLSDGWIHAPHPILLVIVGATLYFLLRKNK